MEVRDNVLKSLETARNEKLIGAPLEARVRLAANGDLYPLLERVCAGTAGALHRVAGGAGRRVERRTAVRVERAAGEKCERCWKYTTDVGSDARFPTICAAVRRARWTRFCMADARGQGLRLARRSCSRLDRLTSGSSRRACRLRRRLSA